MTSLISQILGCLLLAAGIGAAVGWLLRNLSADKLKQQCLELTDVLAMKEHALETALYDLKVKTSAIQILESKIQAAEATIRAAQRDLTSRTDRLTALQAERESDMQRLVALEAADQAVQQRVRDLDRVAAEQADALGQANQARLDAEQARDQKEQERLLLQERVAELEQAAVDAEQLRQRVEELEPYQGRVHWLEVQLSDRDMEYRAIYHQFESNLAERDRQIAELEPLRQQLQERDEALGRAETAHVKTLAKHEALMGQFQQQHAATDKLRAQVTRDEQAMQEKDEQIARLNDQILLLESQQAAIQGQARMVGERDEEISRLRKRLVEVRAALRIRADGGTVAPRPVQTAGDQLSLHIGPPKPARARQKDDLKSIHGIGPVFERSLNKMGIVTFQQLAKWKTNDLKRLAEKLATDSDRIKRDNWIAEAKKEHFRKYGERL